MKFRKRPVVIEAFQMTPERRASNAEWPGWMHEAWQKEYTEAGALSCVDYPNSDGTDRLQITTLEGVMSVDWGDWIIQGVKGEIYPCKPDIFEATYEAVLDSENDSSASSNRRKHHESYSAIPDVLFDGPAVYSELKDRERRYTTPENVSAVLDAIVRILRQNDALTRPAQPGKGHETL